MARGMIGCTAGLNPAKKFRQVTLHRSDMPPSFDWLGGLEMAFY